MQIPDQRAIEGRPVEALAQSPEARLAERLEADQKTAAAAARHQLHQLGVAADQAGREAEPANPQRDECGEQFGGIVAIRDQVEVDEDDPPPADPADVVDDMADRFLQLLAPPGCRRNAEFAVVGTAPRRLEDGLRQELPAVEQVASGKGQVDEREIARLVVAPVHSTGGKVAEQGRPALFGIADADRIGTAKRLLGDERDVRAAEHDRDTAAAKMRR